MIISASRRTDIPAFYSEWFMNRINTGFCVVPNPFNAKQISTISLERENVDAIVFWSKNPQPLMSKLAELTDRGYLYYFQYTMNDYPPMLEPGLPKLIARLETFEKLSSTLSPWGVIWRYDPIIITTETSYGFHESCFRSICRYLEGLTSRVMLSILDMYKKTQRRLSELQHLEVLDHSALVDHTDMTSLLRALGQIANEHGMQAQTCAEGLDYSNLGISPGKCIDDEIIGRLGGTVKYTKDKGQREDCLCTRSRDIGITDTCGHGCTYCYATRSHPLACRRLAEHDPTSTLLWGKVDLD